ncbi:MAG: hypothetical protein ACYCST_20165, partial [Acidimicrobiales bacterium]
ARCSLKVSLKGEYVDLEHPRSPVIIALWLGHEQISTAQIYLHADLAIKEKALALAAPPGSLPGRFRPSDPLLAFLEAL